MTVVRTDLGNTRPSAKRISFAPSFPITATNVEDAVLQIVNTGAAGTVSVTASPYNVGQFDRKLLVNVAGPVTINLGPKVSRGGFDLEIYDVSGAASTNNISIVPNAGEPIDTIFTNVSPLKIQTDFGGYKVVPYSDGWVSK